MSASAQDLNKTVQDTIKGKPVMINLCSRQGITAFPEMKERYDEGYESYSPDSTILVNLKPLVANKQITIVLGTWCSDSKLYVPYFLKLADLAGIKEKDLTFICVDGEKKADHGLLNDLNIELVPTFIVYGMGKELGRIVEGPQNTLEEDLLTILKK
ncbi:MAG TPA: thioredoxin family protein [Pedobacter sp.]|nr:thioredoxin family protein [Pedobacter sp.]